MKGVGTKIVLEIVALGMTKEVLTGWAEWWRLVGCSCVLVTMGWVIVRSRLGWSCALGVAWW